MSRHILPKNLIKNGMIWSDFFAALEKADQYWSHSSRMGEVTFGTLKQQRQEGLTKGGGWLITLDELSHRMLNIASLQPEELFGFHPTQQQIQIATKQKVTLINYGFFGSLGRIKGQLTSIHQDKKLRKQCQTALQLIADDKALKETKKQSQKRAQNNAKECYSMLDEIEGFGTATITRLMTLTRPDCFCVVNKASRDNLARLHKQRTSLDGCTGYLKFHEDWLWEQPWYRSNQPKGKLESQIWKYRAAYLDVFVYQYTDKTGKEHNYA